MNSNEVKGKEKKGLEEMKIEKGKTEMKSVVEWIDDRIIWMMPSKVYSVTI